MSTARLNRLRSKQQMKITYYTISTRNFAKRGIYRGRRRKLRTSKPGLPRGDKPKIDISKTRTLTGSPWGSPRYPIPRVQQTSVEYSQNLNSLSQIVQSKLQCLGLAVSSYNHSSKAALERLENYSLEISQSSPYLHLYQIIIVDDILGYSRDIGSRNTLWIPSDFTVKELINFLKSECINDPKLCEIRRIDNYLNPFQPNNWKSIDNLSNLDGTIYYDINNNVSQSRRMPIPFNEYREIEPIELLKIREKARNTISDNNKGKEQYVDKSDFFNYWSIPNTEDINKSHGINDKVPKYIINEKSMDDKIENTSYLQQIDKMEEKLNEKLLERKRWYFQQIENIKKTEKLDEKMESLLNDELNENSTILYEINRHKNDVGQHLKILNQTEIESEGDSVSHYEDDNQNKNDSLCSIHFRKKN